MNLNSVIDAVGRKFPGSILNRAEHHGTQEITVAAEPFFEIMKTLQGDKEFGFDMLTDIVGIDRMPREPRFDVIYLLMCSKDFTRLAVKLETVEDQAVPSVSGIWRCANWGEREVFDLMGINFSGHPDLRRILTWENFDGHPLRKDYPLLGKNFDKPFDPDTIQDYC